MIKTGIIGDESSTMAWLIELLLLHPDMKLSWVSDAQGQLTGKQVAQVFPRFVGDTALAFVSVPPLDATDLVFLCCEDGLKRLPQELPSSLRIIDMSPSRLCPDGYTYGLCEMNRKFMVHDCYRVACPSGSAMGVLLGLLPLARRALLTADVEVCSTISCMPGKKAYPMPESNADPESLEYVLGVLQPGFDKHLRMSCVRQSPQDCVEGVATHLEVPGCGLPLDELKQIFVDYYDDHNFVFVTDRRLPLHAVAGTNKCYVSLEKEGDRLLIDTILDTRLKGTAGNAVHVMNLLFGLHERVGLAPLLS
ncbi:MAG: hypothetical protein J6N71_11625 [Muribaculaceae bacterium]|nr:hypothetical protein [Muribaculaceae bacterium]